MKKSIFYPLVLIFAFANVQASSMSKAIAAVKHATPIPGLMMVIRKHGDEINLSEEQQQGIATWAKKYRPIVIKLALEVKTGEKDLHKAALDGVSKEDIIAQLEVLLEKRKEISAIKINCRNNLHKILNDEQWTKLIELYKGM
jgi:hypothetical protein